MKKIMDERIGKNWSWTVLIVRCHKCEGIVEIPEDEDTSKALARHLIKVHDFPKETILTELVLHNASERFYGTLEATNLL